MNKYIKQTRITDLENQLRISEEKATEFVVTNLANALAVAADHFDDWELIGPKLFEQSSSSADNALVLVATSEPYHELTVKELKRNGYPDSNVDEDDDEDDEDEDENNPYDMAKLLLAATEGDVLEAISIIIELAE
jgi:hypothetical protein